MIFPRKSLLSILFAVFVTVGALAIAPHAFAQVVDPTSGLSSFAETAGLATGETLTITIARLIRTVMSILGILAVVLMLVGGFRYMTSGGSDDKIKSAKKLFSAAIVGLVIILSAFAIVQFILGQLMGALNGTSTSSGSGGNGGGYGDGGGTSSQFVLTDVNLECAYAIKNVSLQFTFSKNPSLESINNGGIRVQKSGTDVPGTFAVAGTVATFTPTQDCSADGFPTEHCYDAGADYTIELSTTALKSSADLAYKCDTTYPCTFAFTTGTAVDTEGPTTMEISAPEEGSAVYTNEIRPLQAYTVDDTGVSSLAFTIDNGDSIYDAALSTDSSAGSLSSENFFSTADGTEWYVSSDYATGSHTIRATGTDCAGHASTSSGVSVEVYPASCNDGVANNGEADPPGDCGGTSECGACDGSPCTSNADCSSGYCSGEIDPETGLVIDGVCESVPEITSVSPGDGTEGNIISIIGSGFGSTPGTVQFLGAVDTNGTYSNPVTASEYQCETGSTWTDTQIIVQVSGSMKDGPIRVTTGTDATHPDAFVDATNDDYGATISDFDVNSVVRPGLCPPDPTSGIGHSTVGLSGNNFTSSSESSQGTSTVYFGNYEASDYYSWAAAALSVQVPLLNAREYDTQVWVGDYVCATTQGAVTPQATCATDANCHTESGESCATKRCSGSTALCESDSDCGTDGSCVSLRQGSNKVSFTVVDSSEGTSPVIASVVSGWTACGVTGTRCSSDTDCSEVNPGDTCDDQDAWGPTGQYVTINGTGFGSTAGTIHFSAQDSSGSVAWGDTDFPEACGSDTWSDTEIIVKVPATFTDGSAIGLGATYSLTVETGSASSEATDFTVLDDTPGPGICNLDPVSGPVTTTNVDIAGDNLGRHTGSASVTFSSSESASVLSWDSSLSSVTAIVPASAETGPVYVTDANGYRSNELNFKVGSCLADGDSFCAVEGTSCCSNGECAAVCADEPQESHYSWLFSTTTIPATPKVVVDCSEGVVTSPSPWNNWSESKNICVNAAVTATFDMPMMKWDDLAPYLHVTDPDGADVAGEMADGGTPGGYTFSWSPTEGDFLPSTTYSVTLDAAGIASEDGIFMANDYSWTFTTAATTEPCNIGSVVVSPSARTLTEAGMTQSYLAVALSEDDFCVALDCTNYGWTWDSSQSQLASVEPTTSATGSCATLATAIAETTSGTPVDITAQAVNPTGDEPTDAGQLTINFTDPEVTSWTPSCDTVCLNGGITADFNTVMADETALGSKNFSDSTVTIYSCQDSLCSTDSGEMTLWDNVVSYDLSADSTSVTFTHSVPFTRNTWYRVVISGDVESHSGVALSESGSNYPSEDNGYSEFSNDFSWKFKTKDSDEPCAVDRIETDPKTSAATRIGEEALWQAIPFGAPDSCSVNGQELDPLSYSWDAWTAVDATGPSLGDVATMLNSASDPLRITSVLQTGCSSNCLNTGSEATTSDYFCGNGLVEPGEDCDGGEGCSTITCLHEGASADYRSPSVCGDGAVGTGEECDDSNTDNSDGCSSVCLNNGARKAGTSCDGSTVDQSASDGGEDCDGTAGCSSDCLNEGTVARSGYNSICGNGNVDSGEDCDDGNAASGDGCSSICLYEGASVCAFACRDNPTSDCPGIGADALTYCGSATDACLPVVSPCCGDGRVDYRGITGAWSPRAEDCDDGNATNGDGCSSSCMDEGSSLGTSSYCGDGTTHRTGTNEFNGAVIDTGAEECDAATDPSGDTAYGYWGVSYVNPEAVLDVDATTHTAESSITATETTSGVEGTGTLTLTCSCENDSQCGDDAYGCGTSSCCFERPTVEAVSQGIGETNVCLNAAIYVDFSDVMDASSLMSWDDTAGPNAGVFDFGEGHQNLYLALTTSTGEAIDIADCPSGYLQASLLAYDETAHRSWIARAWNWVVRSVTGMFGGTAQAADTTAYCLTPVTYALTANEFGGSRVSLNITDVLEANSYYTLVVVEDADLTDAVDGLNDGVLSAHAVGVDANGAPDGEYAITFQTGTEICGLDSVTVEDTGVTPASDIVDPSVGSFTASGEQHAFVSIPNTVRGGREEEIQPTASYGWSWTWDSTVVDADTENIVSSASSTDAASTVTASDKTGQESVVATAAFSATNTFGETSGGVSGTLKVVVNVCDNVPTVENSNGLYLDADSNFSFFYCQDAGVAKDTTDDLPELETPIAVESYTSDIIQDLIFKVEGTSDAIGVRVLPNSSYLTPSAWYVAQGFTGGSPSSTTVDGYEAITDGNTTYVAATNVANSGTIYPNVYAISYTENAEASSQEIFAQILANWSFNANDDVVTDINLCQSSTDGSYPTDATTGDLIPCVWDGDCASGQICDADKAKLTRDMRRLEDVVVIAGELDGYGAANGLCSVTTNQTCTADDECPGTETCEPSVPKLADGTFVSSYSVSTWPSWTAGLGNALGTSLPTDPVNEFMNCDGENDESATCWNSVAATFTCPDDSHVYGYRSVGGTSFELSTELEFDAGTWADELIPSTLGTVTAEYHPSGTASPTNFVSSTDPAAFCSGMTLGTSSICGDGVVNTKETDPSAEGYEACEIGDTTTVDCTDSDGVAGTMLATCLSDCSAFQDYTTAVAAGGVCTPYSCGNGVVDGATETCDDGALNGTYGHCGDDCMLTSSFSCGDGYLAGGEQCDCGVSANFTAVMHDTTPSWARLNHCTAANGQYQTSPTGSCSYDCKSPGPSCGDGEVNGDEQCDGGYQKWSGALCADATECTTNADCTDGSSCGDGGASCGSSTVCATDGNADSITDIDSGSICDSSTGLKVDGTSCDAIALADGNGSCGTVVYDLARSETCSTSACTWETWTACVSADYCGNGTVDGTEVCDDGNTDNTDACTNDCKANVCGDEYVYSGVESCDDGSGNGDTCTAVYEGMCHYCTINCQYKTKSGDYCGDGMINGTELCDGADIPFYCFDNADGEGGTSATDLGGTCGSVIEGTEGSSVGCDPGFTCRELGVCNGGSKQGERCTVVSGHTSTTEDRNACGADSECVVPTCDSTCSTSCPFSYQTVSVLGQTSEAGGTASDTINLYSYPSDSDLNPDSAVLYIPACSVGTQITADVDSTSNVIPPSVDIVFVTDYTKTMGSSVDGTDTTPDTGTSRIEYTATATLEAISTLFSSLGGAGSTVRASAVRFYGGKTGGVDSDGDDDSAGFVVDQEMTDSQEDLETAVLAYGTADLQTYTPHYKGLAGGLDQLADSTAEQKIVVFLSDGIPNIDADGNYTNDTGETTQDLIEEVYNELVDALPSDTKIFTAAITSVGQYQGYMAHISSDTCTTDWGHKTDCDPTNNVEYAYQATSAAEITTMYQDIVNSILDVTVGLTSESSTGTSETTTGTVSDGNDKSLPFPPEFECTREDMSIPMSVTFSGTGYITFSNMNFTYCPAP